jgi:hypothetical protein
MIADPDGNSINFGEPTKQMLSCLFHPARLPPPDLPETNPDQYPLPPHWLISNAY